MEVIDHINHVRGYLHLIISGLRDRASVHDASKLVEPEKSGFEAVGPLSHITYGSREYDENMDCLRGALDHHYKHNSHHPEHYANGVAGMDLLDLNEMFCDWLAATLKHHDGNIFDSIDHGTSRFRLDPQIASIFRNTAIRVFGEKDDRR